MFLLHTLTNKFIGIVLFELFSYGDEPYADITDNKILIEKIQNGYRPSPQSCPPIVQQLMSECLHAQASSRPSFRQILQKLSAIEMFMFPPSENPNNKVTDYGVVLS